MKKLPNPREARKLAKMTQEHVAKVAGLSVITIKRREALKKWSSSAPVREAHQRACGLNP